MASLGVAKIWTSYMSTKTGHVPGDFTWVG